jgi:hypothetical protein
MIGTWNGSSFDHGSSSRRAAGAGLTASRLLTLLLALLIMSCGGGGDSVSGAGGILPSDSPHSGSSTTPPASGVDTTAPSVPTGLVASPPSGSQINLSWNAATDNVGVTGYIVYLNGVPLTTTTGTSFSHTGLAAGTTYSYRVSAHDAVPNHSAWSATPVAVTTPGSGGSSDAAFFCTFPTAPTDCGFRVQEKVPGRASVVGFGRDGGTALRLHTEPGDNNVANSGDMQRTDLYLAHAGGAPIVFNEGEEQWWAVSMMFPNDFVFPTWQNYNLQGFHHTGSTGSGNFRVGFERGAGLPTTAPGVWVFRGHGGSENQTQFVQPIGVPARNTWYDFVYHVKWSSGSGGFFRAWVNGVKKLDFSGPTLYAGQGTYFKLANYHTPVCDPYPACIGTDPPSSIIYDRVVRGPTPQSVSLGPLEGVLTVVNGVLTQVGGF